MESIIPEINALHEAFCSAAAQEVTLNNTFERYWRDAITLGVTPDDVRLCVKSRVQFNHSNGFKKSLALWNLIGTDDGVARLLSEAAEARALMRVKIVPEGKAQVLRATGRSAEAETNRVVSPAEIEAIAVLRRAAG